MSRGPTRRYRFLGALTTTLLVAAVVGATAGARGSTTVAPSEPANPTIVLVHGAWADSSSWSKEAEAS